MTMPQTTMQRPSRRHLTPARLEQPSLGGLLDQFAPISLAELAQVTLLNRTDSKYVFGTATLLAMLPALQAHYRVLSIAGLRQHRYRTLYFDTADYQLFQRHHAGGRQRFKVRSRQYVDTQLNFFEIKHKINPLRTIKHRLETAQFVSQITPEAAAWAGGLLPFAPEALEPALINQFQRITLASERERVTLDVGLRFQTGVQSIALSGLVIAEVKQGGINHQSPCMRQLRQQHIHQTGFSKYCIGTALLKPQIKHNNFKAILHHIATLAKGSTHE